MSESYARKLYSGDPGQCNSWEEYWSAVQQLDRYYAMSPTPEGLLPTIRGLERLVGASE